MRVYTRVVIDIRTLKEIEEVYEAYKGPVTSCGGGGGQSGEVTLPKSIEYTFNHMMYANRAAFDGHDMVADIINAKGNDPFANVNAIDPDTDLDKIDTEIGLYNTLIGALSETTDWAALMVQATATIGVAFVTVSPDAPSDIAAAWLDPSPGAPAAIATAWIDPTPAAEAEIAADVDAYEAIMDDRVESDALPRFQRGMQNIGAIMSSAFVIGQAIIEGMANRDIAKYQGQLRTASFLQADEIKSRSELAESSKIADAEIQDDALVAQSKLGESNKLADAHIQDDQIATAQAEQQNKMKMLAVAQMLQCFMRRVDGELQVSGLIMEANRIRIIAVKEEAAEQLAIEESEALWNFTLWQHAANMLAAPSGAAMVPGKHMTRQQSALTGAGAGAATGAQVGGGYGAIIGAVVGGAAGYFG